MHRPLALLLLLIPSVLAAHWANADQLFTIDARSGPIVEFAGDHRLIPLVQSFIDVNSGQGFELLVGLENYSGSLTYGGAREAILFEISDFGRELDLRIPGTDHTHTFRGSSPSDVSDRFEDWVRQDGVKEWAAFLQQMNAVTPFALLSGNPRSTVALLGGHAYRKFGSDRSWFRSGADGAAQWGAIGLRFDAGLNRVRTDRFDGRFWTFDPSLTIAGQLTERVALSFAVIGQYRSYGDATQVDLGLELAVPFVARRSERVALEWIVTPFVQAGGGASLDFAAGGLILGGGGVSALEWRTGRGTVVLSNEIAYYGGLPIDELAGFDFDTELSQLIFKNGLEGSLDLGRGFYVDAGAHFTNFAIDAAAVSWFATPTLGVGWRQRPWFDFRLAYEVDVGEGRYVSNDLRLKFDFFF